jgi:Putative Flp pilus-assembly TadE/G-like
MGPQAVRTMSHSEPTPTESRIGPRRRIVPRGESGQIILMYLFFLLPMTMIVLSVFNVGQIVSEKMLVQNAADNAAYSAAVWEARYMNLTAYTSRAMVANYDTMATVDALWSMMDSLDGFLFLLVNVLKIFFNIGSALEPIHIAANLGNQAMAKLVGSNGKNGGTPGIERAIELYNDFLSMTQVALYVSTQFGRMSVIKSIAWSTDKKIEYNTIAEILNALSLDNRVKWDKTDKENGLRLTTERSLNDFSNGEALRDFLENALPSPFRQILDATHLDLLICDVGVTVGPKGFNGPFFNHKTGSTSGDYSQDDDTVIIQPDKIYQHDFFGISVEFCFSIDFGHHSDDAFNSGLSLPHIVDAIPQAHDQTKHAGLFDDNKIDCSSLGGAAMGEIFGPSGPMGMLGSALQVCDANQRQCQQDVNSGNSPSVPCQVGPLPGMVQGMADVAGEGLQTCDQIQDEIEDVLDEVKDQAQDALGNPCATIYEWADKPEDVKVTFFRGDDAVKDGRRVEGPTVFVYFRKQRTALPLFAGLGLDNKNDLEAYSMAKVYYMQRVGDKDDEPCSKNNRAECNRESVFNPFWSARLERPDLLGGIFLH